MKYLIVYCKEGYTILENEIVEWDKISTKNIVEFEIPIPTICTHRIVTNIIKLDE